MHPPNDGTKESSSTNLGGLNVEADPGMIRLCLERWLDQSEEQKISERSPVLRVRLHASAARAHNHRRTADAAQPTLWLMACNATT